jgi:hypothetical protein
VRLIDAYTMFSCAGFAVELQLCSILATALGATLQRHIGPMAMAPSLTKVGDQERSGPDPTPPPSTTARTSGNLHLEQHQYILRLPLSSSTSQVSPRSNRTFNPVATRSPSTLPVRQRAIEQKYGHNAGVGGLDGSGPGLVTYKWPARPLTLATIFTETDVTDHTGASDMPASNDAGGTGSGRYSVGGRRAVAFQSSFDSSDDDDDDTRTPHSQRQSKLTSAASMSVASQDESISFTSLAVAKSVSSPRPTQDHHSISVDFRHSNSDGADYSDALQTRETAAAASAGQWSANGMLYHSDVSKYSTGSPTNGSDSRSAVSTPDNRTDMTGYIGMERMQLGLKVLVADDEHINRRLLQRMLEKLGERYDLLPMNDCDTVTSPNDSVYRSSS